MNWLWKLRYSISFCLTQPFCFKIRLSHSYQSQWVTEIRQYFQSVVITTITAILVTEKCLISRSITIMLAYVWLRPLKYFLVCFLFVYHTNVPSFYLDDMICGRSVKKLVANLLQPSGEDFEVMFACVQRCCSNRLGHWTSFFKRLILNHQQQ